MPHSDRHAFEHKFIPVIDAIQLLRDEAWARARPLVPLFGAGISIESGIPLIGPIHTYLEQLIWCHEHGLLPGILPDQPLHAYLLRHGWPTRQDVHQLLIQNRMLNKNKRPSVTSDDIHKAALASLQLPGDAQWWQVFDAITESHAGLKDRFFDDLIRRTKPARSHQHAAFLANTLNWSLILTTNFDSLLEDALEQQGMRFAVYALPESGPMPHPDLVRSNRSLIKLHGSAFALLAGSILDVPLEYSRREVFMQYIPERAILLIIGYKGGDKRVTNLIRRHCEGARESETRVVWVCRTNPPNGVDGVQGVKCVRYRDGGAFLQDIDNQFISSHPASPSSYHALPQIPPPRRQWSQRLSGLSDYRVVVFYRRFDSFGTTAALVDHASSTDRDVIWCHLERIPNVDALIAHLQRELSRHDRNLPPFGMFRTSSWTTGPHRDFHRDDPRIDYLINALQRGRYLVAFDSMGEFGQPLSRFRPQRDRYSAENGIPAEQQRLRSLLQLIIERRAEIGDSQICVAFSPVSRSDNWSFIENQSVSVPSDVDHDRMKGYEAVLVGHDNDQMVWPLEFVNGSEDTDRVLSEMVSKGVLAQGTLEKLKSAKPHGANPREFVKQLVRIIWEGVTSWRVMSLLIIASAFRRSRGIVGLRRLVIPVWSEFDPSSAPGRASSVNLSKLWTAIRKAKGNVWVQEANDTDRKELDVVLRWLDRLGLLVHQEGGHWWMHRVVKEAVSELASDSRKGEESRYGTDIADLHDTIAVYYFERLFNPSKDAAAFVEYLYHRSRSLEGATSTTTSVTSEIAADLLHRLEELSAVMWRCRDHLLSQRQADTLVVWTRELADDVVQTVCEKLSESRRVDSSEVERVRRELRATLCDLHAEVRRQKNDYYGCIIHRMEQIRDRLDDNKYRGGRLRFSALANNWDKLADKMVDHLELKQEVASDGKAAAAQDAFEEPLLHVLAKAYALCKPDKDQEHSPVSKLCQTTGNLQAAIDGLRLVEHLIDLAGCAAALGHSSPLAATDAEERAVDAVDVLVALFELIDQMLDKSALSKTASTTLRTFATRALIRAGFRIIEARLSHYSLWRPPAMDSQDIVDANAWFDKTMRRLGEFSGLEERDALHYRCFLKCLRATSAYLKGDLFLAHQLLETAAAAVTPPRTGSEMSALAVCHLKRAECLIKDSDDRITRGETERGRSYLKRVAVELAQAKELLSEGRPHVRWWTLLYILLGQVEHEWLAMRLLDGDVQWPLTEQIELMEHLHLGLKAIRLGFDCARQDPQRRKQLDVLAKQFCIWVGFAQEVSRWNALNEEGALSLASVWEEALNTAGVNLAVIKFEEEIERDEGGWRNVIPEKAGQLRTAMSGNGEWGSCEKAGFWLRQALLALEAELLDEDRGPWSKIITSIEKGTVAVPERPR